MYVSGYTKDWEEQEKFQSPDKKRIVWVCVNENMDSIPLVIIWLQLEGTTWFDDKGVFWLWRTMKQQQHFDIMIWTMDIFSLNFGLSHYFFIDFCPVWCSIFDHYPKFSSILFLVFRFRWCRYCPFSPWSYFFYFKYIYFLRNSNNISPYIWFIHSLTHLDCVVQNKIFSCMRFKIVCVRVPVYLCLFVF